MKIQWLSSVERWRRSSVLIAFVRIVVFVVPIALWILLPQTSLAQPCGGANQPSCPTPSAPIELKNPINITSIADFLKELINIAIMIGIPIAVLFIIYAGFLFVTAQGNPAKITRAHQALLAAVIGTAILLGAWVIATAIKGTIDAIRG